MICYEEYPINGYRFSLGLQFFGIGKFMNKGVFSFLISTSSPSYEPGLGSGWDKMYGTARI